METANNDDEPVGRLADRAILVLSVNHADLTKRLERAGARVLTSPKLEIQPPESYAALDEAIENLYGYDWLIFINVDSIKFFLDRFQKNGHEISELDSLRVCALGESAAAMLEASHVHVDVAPAQLDARSIIAELATYQGDPTALNGINFLIPQATIGRDYLNGALEEASARVDVVAAYRTVGANDSSLLRLRTLLANDGIDCAVFTDAAEVHDFARLFDSNDLWSVLGRVPVAILDDETSQAAARFGLSATITLGGSPLQSLPDAIESYFSH